MANVLCGLAVGLTLPLGAAGMWVALAAGPGTRLGAGGLFLAVASPLMALALWRGALSLRRAVTVSVLAALALFAGAQLARPDPYASPWMPRQLPLVLGYAVVTALAVATRRAWGRWLVLGGGLAGVFGFSWIALMGLARQPDVFDEAVWRTVVLLAGSALLLAGMAGPAMRASFGEPPHALASARGARGGLLRAGVLLALAAVPYLLMFAIGAEYAPSRPAEQLLALLAAALLGAGATLVIRGWTAGVAVTCAGALAIVAIAGGAGPMAWIGTLAPAWIGAALALAAVAGPAWRRLRGAG